MEIYIDEVTRSPFEELESSFTFIDTIASGAFGTVVKAIEIKTGQEVAVKIIKKNSRLIDTSHIKEEINILKQLDHPNIVKFYDYIETNLKIYIIMEYIKGGTLKRLIETKHSFSENEACIIIEKLLSAIAYIHSKNVCHRDVKPENIMMNDYNDLTSLKLVDFGLSAQNFDNFEDSNYCGTYLYMAPEQIEKRLYSKEVDVWSVGIILYMLLNEGKHPFYTKGESKKKYIENIKKGNVVMINKVSEMGINLIMSLLERSPTMRISSIKAISHPWITRRVYDPIPMNMIQLLSRRNAMKRLQKLMMISIILNHFSKEKGMIFKINKEYIEQIKQENKKKKEYFRKERERSFIVDDKPLSPPICKSKSTQNVTNSNKHYTKIKILKKFQSADKTLSNESQSNRMKKGNPLLSIRKIKINSIKDQLIQFNRHSFNTSKSLSFIQRKNSKLFQSKFLYNIS